MLFPSAYNDIPEGEEVYEDEEVYKDIPVFDFNIGDFVFEDGRMKMVSGEEALKLMITKLIHTEKFRSLIYAKDIETEEVGVLIESLIGSGHETEFITEYLKGTIKQEIEKLKGVINVDKIEVTTDEEKIIIKCKINSIYNTFDYSNEV